MLKYFCLSFAAMTALTPAAAAQDAAPDAKASSKLVNHAELAKNEAEAAERWYRERNETAATRFRRELDSSRRVHR